LKKNSGGMHRLNKMTLSRIPQLLVIFPQSYLILMKQFFPLIGSPKVLKIYGKVQHDLARLSPYAKVIL